MSDLHAICLLAMFSCAGGAASETTPGSPLPACAPYVRSAEAHNFCLVRAAGDPMTALDVEALCSGAGVLEADCRLVWVQTRLPELEIQDLLAACGPASDCALVALDGRPAPLDAQLPLYRAHAGPYALDCARHALSRWIATPDAHPDDLIALETSGAHTGFVSWPEEIGRFMAAAVVCRDRGTCAGPPEVVEICEISVSEVRADPGICDRLISLEARP